MMLFIHGGAWASGERWHYAPMATRLADNESIIVGIASYSLFPDAKIDDMIVDVQAAIERFHEAVVHEFAIGDPNRFTLVGHSSGAHVTALAPMKHSEKLKIQTQLLESRGGRMSQKENRNLRACTVSTMSWFPSCFIGICGVYGTLLSVPIHEVTLVVSLI